jgi:hypothetical protein
LTAAIDAAKKDASDAVTKAIEEHTAEMKTMIENGDKATDDKLQAQVTALNNAIEAAKTLSTDATNAVRDELTAAIAASKKETSDAIAKSVDALSKELTAKIEAGDLKSDADIKAAVADMTAAVELAKTVASDADAALKAELEAKNIRIQQLDTEVANLTNDKNALTAKNAANEQVIANQDKAMHTAWYVIAKKKSLKAQNILKKGDVMESANVNKDGFTEIDIRKVVEIPVGAKKARILSAHPEGSYEIVNGEDGLAVVKILDPQTFWSVTRYLVVRAK